MAQIFHQDKGLLPSHAHGRCWQDTHVEWGALVNIPYNYSGPAPIEHGLCRFTVGVMFGLKSGFSRTTTTLRHKEKYFVVVR